MNGWIKLWRCTLDHHVWQLSSDQFKVWCALLMLASFKDTEWFDGKKRIQIPEGCLITSQESLAKLCKVGRQTIRTCLQNLTSLESISTRKVTNRCTIISITNWPIYQGNDDEANQAINQPLTNRQPTPNQPLTTSEEDKKVRRKEKEQVISAEPKKGNGSAEPSTGLDPELKAWILDTTHLRSLAADTLYGYWMSLEKAYDQYEFIYFQEELRKADAWIFSNPQRKPTPKGMPRFFRTWLENAVKIGRIQRAKEETARRQGADKRFKD